MSDSERPGVNFLAGGGELAGLMRDHDWSGTPLGDPETWPQSLRTAVRIMLTSRQPIWIGWGPELTYLYNDSYKSIIGGKHPWALGQPTAAVWCEIWDDIGPMLSTAMRGDEGTYVEEQLLIMERNGYPEETYYTFSYSPIPDDDGGAGGIICANAEDTGRVVGERQLATLRDLAAETSAARSWCEACERSAAALSGNAHDLPFAMIYAAAGAAGALDLVGTVGDPSGDLAPDHLDLASAAAWPIADALANREATMIDLADRFTGSLSSGAWNTPPRRAVLLPIAGADTGRSVLLIAGLNPFRQFDDGYRGFLGLVAGQIASAIANADAYDRERQRAEALAELDRAKTLFFSNVSHEFRTPLTLLLGPLEEMLARPADPAVPDERALVETAHRNALRLMRLVNALLDFSRIEAGRIDARFAPTDLAAYTADLASSFRSLAEKAGLGFDVDTHAAKSPVHIDRAMWETIVLNLLSNAFKFTLDGRIGVALDEIPSADGPRVRLSVSDTGTGIAAVELPRLFERFHRVAGAEGRSFEGSGIGLAMVQELVQIHGGTVTVESEPGRGTRFDVLLPIGTAHLPQDRIVEPAATASRAATFVDEASRWLPDDGSPAAAAPAGTRGRILLADDNGDMRDYVGRLLEQEGYAVAAVADGAAALDAIRADRPDLLLTDVMMPRLDGFGLLRAVRLDESLRDVPVIMLSARAGEEAEIDGISAGADDYLVKPFSARELLARVAANIATARVRRDAAAALAGELEQRRLAEDRLRELNTMLEERVVEEVRRRAETEEALRQAQKMEAVGQLTGGIAHDFNNLLTIVTGNIDLAGRALDAAGVSDARAGRALANAMKGAERAASLTQRLLAFSRRQPLAPKAIDVDRLVLGMSDLLHRALGETIRLEVVTSPGLWRVEIDPNQLESAILNLAVNARDAMPQGGELAIETANARLDEEYSAAHAEVAPGHYVVITVTDTGEGMSKETIARVFEPFFTTKEVGKGTGLGLSMVYGFVKQSGGHVKIYSEKASGTSVKIYLPRLLSVGHAEEVAPHSGVELSSHEETILVVEDDDDVRAYTVDILRELGYRVLEAHDGPSAMRLVERRAEPLDLLFTDVVMPRMTGSELAALARRRQPDLKVLYTSGYTRNAIVHGGRLDAGVEMIAKPFTYAALAQKVRDVLDAGQTRRVLIVEQDAAVRTRATEAVGGAGYNADEAATAAEAIGKLRAAQGRYDAVVIDLDLPGSAGETLATEMRAQYANLPLLLAAADPDAGFARRFTGDRCVAAIGKPFTAARLLDRLRELGLRCGSSA